MPEIRYYTVQQIREVKVSAESAVAAALIASDAFKSGQGVSGSEGRTTAPIRETSIEVREDRF